MESSGQDTLPDDAWKDSFDKLLEQKPILRQLNLIKRDVRASFNMNSSYENSYNNTRSTKFDCGLHTPQKNEVMNLSGTSIAHNDHNLNVPKNIRLKTGDLRIRSKVVSTPIKNYSPANPFKCTLSPIGPWELRHFKCSDKNEDAKKDKTGFNATHINNNIVLNVEYIGEINCHSVEKETTAERYSLEVSPLALVRNKWKSKQKQKQVCFETFNSEEKVDEPSDSLNQDVAKLYYPICLKFELHPGKWRKSLNCLRQKRNQIKENDANHETTQTKLQRSLSTGVVERPKSLTAVNSVAGNRKSICVRLNSNEAQRNSRPTYNVGYNDFKHQILQRCGQRRIYAFHSAYNEHYLRNCCKIGEGAFGEVFVYSRSNEKCSDSKNTEKTVLKVIPIEGKQLVNGEMQKTFEQILPEVIISMELSGLHDDYRKTNITSGFVNLQKVRCVKGQYPSYLQKLWEEYDLEKESENDHPKCFTSNQIYIVLELAYSGQDLEGFHFNNAEQSFSALQQIIFTLAVGEKEYQFEHRDLHWGNVLVLNTNQQFMSYKLDEDILTIPSKGVKITIIDYTLSRMTFNDYCFYNDLSNDEDLFTATGDYQFEIYRMMRKHVNNKWETFEPKTNIFWISYIISKLFEGVTYKNTRSKNHLHCLEKLKRLQSTILTYKSCAHCARDMLLY